VESIEYPLNSKSFFVVAGIFPFQMGALLAASNETKAANQ